MWHIHHNKTIADITLRPGPLLLLMSQLEYTPQCCPLLGYFQYIHETGSTYNVGYASIASLPEENRTSHVYKYIC